MMASSSSDDDRKTRNTPLIHAKETWFKENYSDVKKAMCWVTRNVHDTHLQYVRKIMAIELLYKFVYIAGGGALTNDEIAILESIDKNAASFTIECVEYLTNEGVPTGLDKQGFDKWKNEDIKNFIKNNMEDKERKPILSDFNYPTGTKDFEKIPSRYQYSKSRHRK